MRNCEQRKDTIGAKSMDFAVRIVNLCDFLSSNFREYPLFNQLLRSGTSIGANVAEAKCGISERDFYAKMYIAFKECAETRYWLRLMQRTNHLTEEQFESIYNDCNELYKILSSITKTTRDSLNKNS